MISLSSFQPVLERNRATLRRRDRLWSAARFVVFVLAFVVVLFLSLKTESYGSAAPWIAFLTGGAVFAAFVSFHRRNSECLAKYAALETLIRRDTARRSLDWARIPETPAVPKGLILPRYFSDLDLVSVERSLPSLLRLVDCSLSTGGWRKVLGAFDSNDVSAAELLRRQKAVEELRVRSVFRRRILIQAGLSPEGLLRSEILEAIFGSPSFPMAANRWLMLLAGVQFCLALLVSFFGWNWAWGYLAVFFLIRLMESRVEEIEHSFDQALSMQLELDRFAPLARELERFHSSSQLELARVLAPYRGELSPSRSIRSLDRIVSFMSFRANPILHLMLNLAVPWDLFWAMRLDLLKRRLHAAMPAWLDSLAELEACLSLAEFDGILGDGVLPGFQPNSQSLILDARGIAHPLIPRERRVPNSVVLDPSRHCILITGSNMSGKSTFLRTLGIHILLAKAGARVPCQSLTLSNVNLRTCLRITDSVTDQISSFYAEVKELRAILDDAELSENSSDRPGLIYLIDEIFRGTNNRERLMGSRAYIRTLVRMKRVSGLIATHDLELAELAQELPGLANAHFRETVEDGRMRFDYRMSSGPSPSTNALLVMKSAGLPISETASVLPDESRKPR